MIRTLVLVTVLVGLAGFSVGFFVADAADRALPSTMALDPALEAKVADYQRYYGLDAARSDEVRRILREYDDQLRTLLLRLRQSHRKEFNDLFDSANARLGEVLGVELRRSGGTPPTDGG